jgi:replication-associated recombination protein RarA
MTNFTPTTTQQMVFSDNKKKGYLISITKRQIDFPADGMNSILLHGTYGTGKTTYADIFFSEYEKSYGGDFPIIDKVTCDGSVPVSSLVKRFNNSVMYISQNLSNKHYLLLDEFDNYSLGKQKQLKGFLNRENIVCIFTTNYLDMIDKGIQSRSLVVGMNQSNDVSDYVRRMREIVDEHRLAMPSQTNLVSIAQTNDGDWRKMCGTLRRVCAKISAPTYKPSTTKKNQFSIVKK